VYFDIEAKTKHESNRKHVLRKEKFCSYPSEGRNSSAKSVIYIYFYATAPISDHAINANYK
jgi:hypothetical protein